MYDYALTRTRIHGHDVSVYNRINRIIYDIIIGRARERERERTRENGDRNGLRGGGGEPRYPRARGLSGRNSRNWRRKYARRREIDARRSLYALSVLCAFIVIVVLLNTLYLIAARVPRGGSHVRPSPPPPGAPFIFFRTRAKPSLSPVRTIHALPPVPRPPPVPGNAYGIIISRRATATPTDCRRAVASVGPPESVQHDDRVTDNCRRLQQIRQGEWTSAPVGTSLFVYALCPRGVWIVMCVPKYHAKRLRVKSYRPPRFLVDSPRVCGLSLYDCKIYIFATFHSAYKLHNIFAWRIAYFHVRLV